MRTLGWTPEDDQMKIVSRPGATDRPTSARGRRHGRTPRVGLAFGAAMAAVLLAGCGGSSSGGSVAHSHSTTTANSATKPSTRPSPPALAKCMRAHGVPNFPHPTSNGEIGNNGAVSGVNESSPAFQGAARACSKFLFHPPGLPGAGPATN